MPLVSKSSQGRAALVFRRRSQRSRPLEWLPWRIARTDPLPTWHVLRVPRHQSQWQLAYLAGDDLIKIAHFDYPVQIPQEKDR